MNDKTHWAQVLHWSVQEEIVLAELLVAGLGMAGPLAWAAWAGHLPLGLAAAVGALAVSGVGHEAGWRAQAAALRAAWRPSALAAVAAALCAGHGGWTSAIVVLLAMAAGAVGGYSRPMAVAGVRFCMFLIISTNVMESAAHHRVGLLLLMAAGSLWTGVLSLLAAVLLPAQADAAPAAAKSAARPTPAQLRAHWRRTMRQLAGWQYALRLGSCLAVAGLLQWFWPGHHLTWVALTVAILTQRQMDTQAVKISQRALGTVLGVLLASVFLFYTPPMAWLVAGVALLAALRPLLRARNYLAYSIIMGPLMVLLMDGSGPVGPNVLEDRLLATLAGAALVVGAGVAITRLLGTQATIAVKPAVQPAVKPTTKPPIKSP